MGAMGRMYKMVVCLWVAAAGWGGAVAEIGSNMNNISGSMLRDLTDVLGMVEVSYSEPVINVSYVASVQFDMRAMGPVYNSTHLVIDAIANKQAYPEGMVTVSDGHAYVKPLKEEWRALLVHYAGPTAVIVVAVLLIAILPLAGLFWCCCYWCRMGRRRRPFDRKYDACLKGILAIILIGLLTLFLFGVVCAFATDSQVETGSAEAADSLKAGIRDAREFLNATQAHARWLLVVNYRELEIKLNSMLYSIGVTASVKLGEFSRAVSVTTLNKLVQQLDGVREQLRSVHALTATLRAKAEELNTGLRKVKNQLLQTLAKCDQPKCRALQDKYKIGQLDTEIQYSQMPDVTELLNNVSALLDSDIKSEVAAGQQVFSDIQRGIQRSVDQHMPDVSQAIADIGKKLAGVADEITWMAGNASAVLQRQESSAAELRRLHATYGPYRRYAGLAAAIALLLITCLLAWGLMCGVCGKRPDVYGASDCCNKGAGSKSLLCGMGAMFLLGSAVTLVLLVYFIVGVATQRFVCDPLTEPRDNRLFGDLEQLVDFENMLFNERRDPDFNMTAALLRCHDNQTIYQVLHLHRLVNLSDTSEAVRGSLTRHVAALRPLLPGERPVAILRPGARDKLRRLADSGLSDFDFERILAALETNMTTLALDSLARQLNSTAASLQRPQLAEEARSLRSAAAALAALMRDVLRPMLDYSAQLNSTATKLRDGLRFNHSSLKDAITYLMHETSEAEVFLNTEGPDRVQNMTAGLADAVALRLEQYVQRLAAAARDSVGRCGPLSNAFNATRDAACRKILMPVNGYWMSLAWCVVLLAPLLLVAARLARLYLHADAYPGPLVEAAYKVEKRSAREPRDGRASPRARARAPAAAPPAPRAAALAPPADHYHARRYNDMAPKHWEEGPPRYLGSTEYERPPPYYYPGPNPVRVSSRDDMTAVQLTPKPPTGSWAEYLGASSGAPRLRRAFSMEDVPPPPSKEPATSWAQYLAASESSLSRPMFPPRAEQRAAPSAPREPVTSWAEYLAASPSAPVFPEPRRRSGGEWAAQGTGWSWAQYLGGRASDRQ
ncbi:prominin-like protein isoform X2 [Helicoverpa zea]|uniref:prominin-like protein isoform X2 n=1 Tax=Helicoverpa zea TaxID=7113 RepID=UPI001F580AA0|nr:prominin-like protein isoform X2 [Helicoverpa zea]